MKKMTMLKIALVVIVVGILVFLSCKWSVKLDPPGELKPVIENVS